MADVQSPDGGMTAAEHLRTLRETVGELVCKSIQYSAEAQRLDRLVTALVEEITLTEAELAAEVKPTC